MVKHALTENPSGRASERVQMVDRTNSSALTQLIQDGIGKHLRSVYDIEQDMPDRIFKLLQLIEEKAPPPGERDAPSPHHSAVDETKS
jgi:hypothetical protein